MLTTPIFRPWRSLWDAHLPDLASKLDELVKQRQKGRQVPPRVHNWPDVELILLALHHSGGKVSSSEFIEQKIEPILKACVWPRWLLLEEALEHAANSGDLHLSALVLRSQIEELDALKTVATVLARREDGSWDGDTMVDAIRTLQNRVLPRLQVKQEEQLIEPASDKAMAAIRLESLQQVFDGLSEYVHPNYGSHALSVRPHSIEAAKVFFKAFVTIYETFLSLPWVKDDDDTREELVPRSQTISRNPFLILADDTIPNLKSTLPPENTCKNTWMEVWEDAVQCFRHCANCESNWDGPACWPSDVEAIQALNANSIPLESWPEALRTVAGQNRYTFLVAQEHRLAQAATPRHITTDSCNDKMQLSVLVSSLSFAINVTEHKLSSMARQAALLINAENVLGVALILRSMLEHHAVAIELGGKLQTMWAHAQKHAPDESKLAEAFAIAEKQLARVLAGSSEPSGIPSGWRSLWKDTVSKPYNVLGPVKALNTKQTGALTLYGLLSHIMHGTVGTGGDLLGAGGDEWKADHKQLAAKLTLILSSLCDFDAMMERQAASMCIGLLIDKLQSEPSQVGGSIKAMRTLEGQMLKSGRDIFGAGTENNPYRFRDGLCYHDAYYHYLVQEGIQVRNRRVAQLGAVFCDQVETVDGRVLYFQIPMQ